MGRVSWNLQAVLLSFMLCVLYLGGTDLGPRPIPSSMNSQQLTCGNVASHQLESGTGMDSGCRQTTCSLPSKTNEAVASVAYPVHQCATRRHGQPMKSVMDVQVPQTISKSLVLGDHQKE